MKKDLFLSIGTALLVIALMVQLIIMGGHILESIPLLLLMCVVMVLLILLQVKHDKLSPIHTTVLIMMMFISFAEGVIAKGGMHPPRVSAQTR